MEKTDQWSKAIKPDSAGIGIDSSTASYQELKDSLHVDWGLLTGERGDCEAAAALPLLRAIERDPVPALLAVEAVGRGERGLQRDRRHQRGVGPELPDRFGPVGAAVADIRFRLEQVDVAVPRLHHLGRRNPHPGALEVEIRDPEIGPGGGV